MDSDTGETKPIKAVLTITLFVDQSVKVEGPVSDKFVSYAMLETARDAIFETHLMNKLKPKNGKPLLPFLRGMR